MGCLLLARYRVDGVVIPRAGRPGLERRTVVCANSEGRQCADGAPPHGHHGLLAGMRFGDECIVFALSDEVDGGEEEMGVDAR